MADTLDYDCLIVGGGLVGASLALALSHTPLRVGVIEASAMETDAQPSFDDRGLVLSRASARILDTLGALKALRGDLTPITSIHVSERGRFGCTRMEAGMLGVSALGYSIIARRLGVGLLGALRERGTHDYLCPASLSGVRVQPERVVAECLLDGRARRLSAKLLVGADGANSSVRRLLGMSAATHDYGQTAIVSNVVAEHHRPGTAYERFTATGPIVLLPLTQQRCGMVYTVPRGERDRYLAMDEAEFCRRAAQRFGYRFGGFARLGRRASYDLIRRVVHPSCGERCVLIGNAAHVVHPNAAQGFNLGLRDAALLAETLHDAARRGRDIGEQAIVEAYASAQWRDQRRTIRFTDGLARLFYNDFAPAVLLRNGAMNFLDLVPPAKRALMRLGTGYAGRTPKLARGVPL